MTVVIRFDPVEHVIRSAGETLPGILGCGEDPDGQWGFTVDSAWTPTKEMVDRGEQLDAAGVATNLAERISGWRDTVEMIDTRDVIEGCVDLQMVASVMQVAQQAVTMAWALRGMQGDVECVRRCLDFVDEVYAATAARYEREQPQAGGDPS